MDYAPIIRREKRSGLSRQEAHEVAEQGIDGEDAGVARDDELLAGTGKHHVQLTVDERVSTTFSLRSMRRVLPSASVSIKQLAVRNSSW